MSNIKLGTKIVIAFLAVGVIPFAVMGISSYIKSSSALSKASFNQLEAVRGIKKAQIEKFFEECKQDIEVLMETVSSLRLEAINKLLSIKEIKKMQIELFFKERKTDITVLSSNATVISALDTFEKAVKAEGDKIRGEQWIIAEKMYGGWLTRYNNEYGYYDLFLIRNNGDVLYTVAQESDLGENLINGSLKDSPLGRCFKKSLNGVCLQDFEPYAPSNNEPCAFVGAPVSKKGVVIGAIILQFSSDAINNIMQQRVGMGETGETYLVGADLRMRSNSFLDPTGHSVKASFAGTVEKNGVDTDAAKAALGGKSGADVIIDYNGNPVLSAYSPLDIEGLNWAILSEIDVAEAFCPKDEKGVYFFKKYKEMYGYNDLLLINPDGNCFYTVAKESDYQTNFLTGRYSNSNLGLLINEVKNSKSFGFVDFAPYAPSNNEPCSFIAQPVVYKGQVEIIIALKLSVVSIDGIMQQRDGMGESGESYLVGSDNHMRSDSFLDSANFSVNASFQKNNLAKSNMINAALKGETGITIDSDYTKVITKKDNIVLSAYTPVNVFGKTWALIAEINKSEAFAAVKMIKVLFWSIALAGTIIIVLIAILITRSITKPINNVIDSLRQGANQVSSASGQVASSSQQMAEGASEQASSLEEVSSSLEEMASMTRQNADNAKQANIMSNEAKNAAEDGNHAMENMSRAISEIKKSSDETAKIIKTIDEIAFQTNLLALNAAVEAARAGEAGKGFAVVAEEVRNLAMRSAEAAKNTGQLIEGSQKNTEKGVKVTQDVANILNKITTSVQKVFRLIEEVSAASDEQAQGIEQVNAAVAQMDQVTQSNASNAEESASASEELSAQSKELYDMVNILVGIVEGSNETKVNLSSVSHNDHRNVINRKASRNKDLSNRTHDLISYKNREKSYKEKANKSKLSFLDSSKVINPEKVIPLDEEELKEF